MAQLDPWYQDHWLDSKQRSSYSSSTVAIEAMASKGLMIGPRSECQPFRWTFDKVMYAEERGIPHKLYVVMVFSVHTAP